MRLLHPLLFALALAAGCAEPPVATCGSCSAIAAAHHATADCCGRGCVITDASCPGGFRYVNGDGKSLAGCAAPNECYSADLSAVTEDLRPLADDAGPAAADLTPVASHD